MWRDFPRALSDLIGCSVFAYSRLGYGNSDPTALPRPPSYMHDEALEHLPLVCASLEYEQLMLVGHSDGASIALIAASARPPPNLRGLVLMAPHVLVEPETLAGITAAAHAYRATDLRDRLRRYHGEWVDGAFWGWNQAWRSAEFARWNIETYLPAVDVPVQLIQGENDPYGTMAQLDRIQSGCTGPVSTLVLKDCAHSPFKEATALTTKTIAQCARRMFNGVAKGEPHTG
jgi:pimeloyl-ACP methyl ester carboxylesterase